MPLTEFLRMSKGKVDATQQSASTSSDPSCRPDDCVELVWENGQITMQGQSSKPRKNPVLNYSQTLVHRTHDARNGSGLRMAKFSPVDSMLADLPLPVSSCEMGLDQDSEMVPWLNYGIEDPLHNNYGSDFLQEFSGVTMNDVSTEAHLASREKRSGFHGESHRNTVDETGSMKNGNPEKAPLVVDKQFRGGSSEVLQFSQPFQHSAPRSNICNVSGSTTGDTHHVTSLDSLSNSPSLCAFTSLRLQKLNAGQPSTNSNIRNFAYFARPTAVGKANLQNINSSDKLKNDDKRETLTSRNYADSNLLHFSSGCSQKENFSNNQSVFAPTTVFAPLDVNSESLPATSAKGLLSSNEAVCREDVTMNEASPNLAYTDTMEKPGMVGESHTERVVAASSVCSGNSVERASDEPTRDLKRKFRETAESEGPSEELEDESVGARKTASARAGSKRSRAAEVHNLSERRRRDRINEKMRALQELIPNCNKVDKASMLDEAIEYLKTLLLQVQILSMGAGMYMQPMMLPPGMQPIHGAHMPHFSPMGVGMGMGYGMNMFDMNSGLKMMPFQGSHYPVPAGPTFQGIPGSSLPGFGHPGQGAPMSMQRAPVLPVSGIPLKVPMVPDVQGVAGSTETGQLAQSSSSRDVGLQVMPGNNVTSSMNQATSLATNEGIERAIVSHDRPQPLDTSEAAVADSGTDILPS